MNEFLIAVAAALIAPAVIATIQKRSGNLGTLLLYVAGAAFLVVALFWAALKPLLGIQLVTSIEGLAANSWVWFFIGSAVWIYAAAITVLTLLRQNNEIIALRNDVQSIANVINRGVLPRRLTPNQKQIISSFLKQFDPYEVAFELIPRNEEAGVYRCDIQEALTKGGWKLSTKDPFTYTDNVSEGLSLDFTQTMAHVQKPHDPKDPSPSLILQQALGLAGVRLNGMGGRNGVDVTDERLVIKIGLPRRDLYELPES